jgi:peptide/nickel transport system substrate-binding protein
MPETVTPPDAQSASATPTPANEPAPASPPIPAETPPSIAPTVSVTTSKKSNRWLYIIIAIVLIVAGAAAWYEAAHKSTSNPIATVTKHDIPLLTYGFDNNPLNAFYPSAAADTGAAAINEQMFEGLVSFSNGTKIVPDLASSWTNPSSTTWIFTLKPNIYYHDGDTVTAADVVYSWQQVNAQNQQLASYATSTIKSVVAQNSNTVEITTSAPDPVLLNRLTMMFIIDSRAPKGTQPWDLGSGAYTVKQGTTPTANSIDLVAFNNWHGGHIYTKEIDYVFYPDLAKSTAALLAGKVDIINGLSSTNTAQIKGSSYQILTPPSLLVDFIGFNNLVTSSPTANAKIRQAIDLTVDPAAVLKAYGVSGNSIDQVIPPQVPGYDASITRPALDLAKAKQLITEAGYPNGVTVTMGVGEPAAAAGQEIVTELAKVGITVKLKVATSEETFFNDVSSGVDQAFYIGYASSITDASDVLSFWQQSPFYDNTTFDAQLTKANQTFNASERLADLQQASQTLVTDNAYVPLFQHSFTFAAKKGIIFPLSTYDGDINSFFSGVYQK